MVRRMPPGGKRAQRKTEDDLRAMDAYFGRRTFDVYERANATPIRKGELVRVNGIGTRRLMRFHNLQILANGRMVATVRDTVAENGRATGGYKSVDAEQLQRVRNQNATK